jgi:mono/diheme cytochrome c family protein
MCRFISLSVLCLGVLSTLVHAQANDAAKQQAAIDAGQQIYLQRCMQCHSTNKDQVMVGPSLWGELTTSPHKKTPAQVRLLLKTGKGKMPSWKGILSDADVNNLLAFLRSI